MWRCIWSGAARRASTSVAPQAAILLTFAVVLGGCAGESAGDAATEGPAIAVPAPAAEPITDLREVSFAPELGIDLDQMELRDSGLYVQVLQTGSGSEAGYGDEMGINYTLWLPNGHKVDSSYDHDPPGPYEIVLGQTSLIDGWVEGVTGMRLGERRRLVVPYDLAYGEQGRAGIPGYSPLVFEVELAEHREAGT